MSKHTPTPWKAIGGELHPVLDNGLTCTSIVARTGRGSIGGGELHRANAQFIARAVNAHEDLLAALKDLVTRCDGDEGVRGDGSNVDTSWAHAVIAKAEGGDA